MATAKKKPTAKQLAARKLFAQRAKAGTLKRVAKKPAAKKAAPKRVARNPIAKTTRSKKRVVTSYGRSGIHYAVLFYVGKNKPTGTPDFVYPVRDMTQAHVVVDRLEAKGLSGCAVIEKTTSVTK